MVPRIGMSHSTTLETECECQIEDLHHLNKFDYTFRVCVCTQVHPAKFIYSHRVVSYYAILQIVLIEHYCTEH